MARINRREVLSAGEIQVVHCVNRCVRKSFLCGTDPLTGDDYEHRGEWIWNRLECLAGIFGIDVLGFSVMSNHLHAILRNRPDVVKGWTDEDVARRWWNLFPSRRNKDGSPAEPAETDLKSLMADAEKQEPRNRSHALNNSTCSLETLFCMSVFMACDDSIMPDFKRSFVIFHPIVLSGVA